MARVGFWRRFAALVIDSMLLLIPLQIVVVILFSATNGMVQGAFGLNFTECANLENVPSGLQPPPPDGSNFAIVCRSSLFGFATAHNLTVGVETVSDNSTTRVYQDYLLDANGAPSEAAFDVTWIAVLALLGYFVSMEAKKGVTVGKRILGIRVIATAEPDGIGVGWKKAFIRQLAMYAGFLPFIAVLVGIYLLTGGEADALAGALTAFLVAGAVAAVLAVIWDLWIVISLVRKQDPIYDRLAGTAVIRV